MLTKLTSLTVLAHGAAQATFSRHVPLWDAACQNVRVVCPADGRMKDCPYPVEYIGNRGHANQYSVDRLREALCGILRHQQGFHMICEYDSFPLIKEIPERKGLIGPLMPNTEPARFIAPRYPNPPWMLDWRSAYLMVEAAQQWPDVMEEGYADRYLAALAHLAGVPILDYDPPGYTRATVEPEHWQEMGLAIRKGARMIHGIKDKLALECALKAYQSTK